MVTLGQFDSKTQIQKAKRWYWWLWLSPLITVPLFIFFLLSDPGYALVCRGAWRNCNWHLISRLTNLLAILGSAFPHLILLIPARNKENKFIRWHGRQMLLLASVRTAIPITFGLILGDAISALLFIPVLIAFWFFSTLWGHRQAGRGDCSLMRRASYGKQPPSIQELDPIIDLEQLTNSLVKTIRFSHDQKKRRQALAKLEELGMAEPL